MNLCADPWPVLKDVLEEYRPEVVLFSFRNVDPLGGQKVSYVSSLKTAAAMVRTLLPRTRLIAGGPAFTLFCKRLMKEVPEIDFGIVGEGETVFPLLFSQNIEHLKTIPGLVRRDGEDIIYNAPERGISMDNLPPVDTNAFDPRLYGERNAYVAAIGIEGKRGCDLGCAYCLYPSLGHNKMRLRNPLHIVDEMEFFRKEYGIRLFHFTDSVLNRPKKHFEALCRELVRRNLDVQWTGFFREDTFTIENAILAKKAGLSAIYFSSDALNEHGLKILNKDLTKEDILKAAGISVESGILTMCHFLVNLPMEEDKDRLESRETIEKILEIYRNAGNLGAVIFNNIRIYPKAPLTEMLLKKGLIGNDVDLLYPFYYDPPEGSHVLHELEALCHRAGIYSRLNIGPIQP